MAAETKYKGQLTRDQVTTQLTTGAKTYSVYDVSERLTDFYEAPIYAVTGTPCLRTQMTYVGTTRNVLKTQESIDLWDNSYDI